MRMLLTAAALAALSLSAPATAQRHGDDDDRVVHRGDDDGGGRRGGHGDAFRGDEGFRGGYGLREGGRHGGDDGEEDGRDGDRGWHRDGRRGFGAGYGFPVVGVPYAGYAYEAPPVYEELVPVYEGRRDGGFYESRVDERSVTVVQPVETRVETRVVERGVAAPVRHRVVRHGVVHRKGCGCTVSR